MYDTSDNYIIRFMEQFKQWTDKFGLFWGEENKRVDS